MFLLGIMLNNLAFGLSDASKMSAIFYRKFLLSSSSSRVSQSWRIYPYCCLISWV